MRICFVGDSMVNGTGDPEFLGWVGRVLREERTRHPELTGYNLGIRRDTSADILARWSAEVTRRLPTEIEGRVVFSFGVNDCVQEIDRAESLSNTVALLEEAKVRWQCSWSAPCPSCPTTRVHEVPISIPPSPIFAERSAFRICRYSTD